MQYLLLDIELWLYNGKNYPKLLKDLKFKKYINKNYNVDSFIDIEKKISYYLKKKGYTIISTMNPLYSGIILNSTKIC